MIKRKQIFVTVKKEGEL